MSVTGDWRRRAVVYQIYPKSFRDGNGDGVGDLRGVIEGLPHLQRLGVDVVWLSPIFTSPMIDNGYDISNFCGVNPLFGSIDDFDELIVEARRRGLRIVLDITVNHCSTAHPWFQEALKHPQGPYRDYFIWREGRCGGPPNNWISFFGGSSWSRPEHEDLYYLHMFDRTQADLNWENPTVRRELYDAMRFWLDRGAGGFRLDVVTIISKPGFNDVADTSSNAMFRHLATGPRLEAYLREMRQEVFAHYDCITIGEAPGIGPAQAARLVDPADPMLDVLYHFDLVYPKRRDDDLYDRAAFKGVFRAWEEGIGARGWNSVVLSNHDLGRIVSRFGDDRAHWRESAKALQALVLLMRGTPFIYQGDEIGMTNAPFASIDELDDVWAKNVYRLKLAAGGSEAEAFRAAQEVTRDHARTPFQWTDAPNGGFCPDDVTPWLRVNPNHATLNAAAQDDDPDSPLAFAKALLALRRGDTVWTDGDFVQRDGDPDDAFVFGRRLHGRTGWVALNLNCEPVRLATPLPEAAVALANLPGPYDPTVLRCYEARVYTPSAEPS